MKTFTGFVFVAMLCFLACATESLGQSARMVGRGGQMGRRAGNPSVFRVSNHAVGDPLPAGTYTVGVAGSFATIDSAIKRLEAGGIAGPVTLLLTDTLYIAPFPPGDFRLIGPIAGTSPASRITIRPADNVAVTIVGSGTATLTFEDVSYVTLDGISLEGRTRMKVHTLANTTYDWNDAIDLWGDCDHDSVQNVTAGTDRITNLWTSTICLIIKDFSAPDSCVVSGVSITSGPIGIFVGGYAPYTQRPKGNVIRGCRVGSPADSLISQGIVALGADGTIVENNHVENLRLSLREAPAGNPLVLGINPYFCRSIVVRNNVVHGLRGSDGASVQGIMASGDWDNGSISGSDIQIYNNMVYDLQLNGAVRGYLGGIGLWRNDTILVAYNTVRMGGTEAVGVGTDALAFDKGAANATVRDNILVNVVQGGGNSAIWADGSVTFTSDYNDLYIDTSVAYSSTVTRWPSPGYRLLTDWQATGQDAHSLSAMPTFRGPDLHIDTTQSVNTLLSNTGMPIPRITADIDGQPRDPSHPDIGADEFVAIILGVEGGESGFPIAYSLEQNYPNPFNPNTVVSYQLPVVSSVRLVVYDLLGREVAVLVNERKEPGNYTVQFNAGGLASGVYFYRLQAGNFVQTKKLLILR